MLSMIQVQPIIKAACRPAQSVILVLLSLAQSKLPVCGDRRAYRDMMKGDDDEISDSIYVHGADDRPRFKD